VRRRGILAVVLLVLVAAPTAGDIGSCGQEIEDLDAGRFFLAKADVDCEKCETCGLTTQACARACGPPVEAAFPDGCYPLVHDGEVCLDALDAASCSDYTLFMADSGGSVPTECNFCPPREAP
jgi:hypothetical protein